MDKTRFIETDIYLIKDANDVVHMLPSEKEIADRRRFIAGNRKQAEESLIKLRAPILRADGSRSVPPENDDDIKARVAQLQALDVAETEIGRLGAYSESNLPNAKRLDIWIRKPLYRDTCNARDAAKVIDEAYDTVSMDVSKASEYLMSNLLFDSNGVKVNPDELEPVVGCYLSAKLLAMTQISEVRLPFSPLQYVDS